MSATLPRPGDVTPDGTVGPDDPLRHTRLAFGRSLAAARVRAGYSLEDVASTTKVAPRLLQALERGDIEQLPTGVYRRGILRNYASAIGLPPDVVVEQYERTFGPPRQHDRPHAVVLPPRDDEWTEETPEARPPRQLGWVLGATAVLVAAVVVWPLVQGAGIDRLQDPSPATDSKPGGTTGLGNVRSPLSVEPNAATRGEAATAAPVEESPGPTAPQLVITSNPAGARVTVNGIGWGVTPVTIRNLPPGEKVIRVTKDGYVASQTSLQFGATGASATVRLTLPRRD